ATPCVLLTFDPHPSEVIRPGSHPAVLSTLRRKAELVEQLGVDVFCVLPFTPELQRLAPDEFVHEILLERLHAATVVVGDNFTFGHKAAGDVATLDALGRRFGFTVEPASLLCAPAGTAETGAAPLTFSSTYIRACIDAGEVVTAAQALGRPHRVEGIVVRGDGRGRELGYPTANLSPPRFAAIPADGIYACWFYYGGKPDPVKAAVSVGTNPTFSGRERRVEAFVLDLDTDLYGQRIAVDFVARIRDMLRFDSPEQLVERMDADVASARELLSAPGTTMG
ncbi:MAG: bifunctional riboflavin kinase/FAD synthetase, partial [Mycobacterium sp.]